MPLPDANNYSMRIYELLKETDLENLSYAQFQAVAEKLFIEPENEDELRRLVLVQLARMAVRGDWDGFISGGSSVPANADYLLAFDQGTVPSELTNARKLVVGNNISMAHGAGDNDDMTISATPGGSDGQIQYNVAGVLAATGLLSTNKTNELTLVAISGDGQINISSSSKAVSLLCDENQKLKVKGATDTFILDVSSSSGGITFPDGTTQTTAAVGSANLFAVETPDPTLMSGTVMAVIPAASMLVGFGGSSTQGMSTLTAWYPFIANHTGDLASITISVNTAAASTFNDIGIYSNTNGFPDSLIGKATFDVSSTGEITQTSLSATISLTKGTMYWVAWSRESGTGFANLDCVQDSGNTGVSFGLGVESTYGLTSESNQTFQISSGGPLPATVTLSSLFAANRDYPIVGLLW